MSKVTVTKTINVPAERAWEILSDYQNIQVFHPMVNRVDKLSEADSGLGAKRRCNMYDKSSAVEEVVAWSEGKGYTVTVTEATKMPVRDIIARMSIEPVGANSSKAGIEMTYTPTWGVIGRVMDLLIIRPMMKKTFAKVIDGLELHAKTGQAVGKNGVLEPASRLAKAT